MKTIVGGSKLIIPFIEKILKASGRVDHIVRMRETGTTVILYTSEDIVLTDQEVVIVAKEKASKKKVKKKASKKVDA